MSRLQIPRPVQWAAILWLFFLSVMTLLRLALYLITIRPGLAGNDGFSIFLLGLRFDMRVTGVFCLLLLLFSLIPALHPYKTGRGKKLAFGLAGVFCLALVLFYVFDFAHFAYLHQRLNASVLAFAEDTKISMGMVWQSYPVLRIVLAALLAFLLLFWLVRRSWRPPAKQLARAGGKAAIAWWAFSILLLGLSVFGRAGQFPLRWSDAFSLGNDYSANMALNPFQSFLSSFQFRKDGFNEKEVRRNYPLMAGYLGLNAADSLSLSFERKYAAGPGLVGKQPNVVLVICESFSAYKSSMWGNPLNTTPFFDQLCRDGLFFDHCFTPHFGTARGVWATITGTPDVMLNKTASRNPNTVNQHSIINDFTGYKKLYFLGGSTSWANIRGLLTNNITGLDLYEEGRYSSPKVDVWGISDKSLFLEANGVLSRQQEPFFAIIQTADNHRPYTIPQADRGNFQMKTFPADTLHKYGFESNEEMNAFRFTDHCFRSFMEAAQKEAYYSNTLFVFIGDHGIRGSAGNMFPAAWTEAGLTCEHVPLLFYAPGRLKPARMSRVCSQVDVLPTIAGMAGIGYRNNTLGRNLLDSDRHASNCAFIIDHDTRQIGLVRDDYYYTTRLSGGETMLPIRPGQSGPAPDSLKQQMSAMTFAFYETAKYLLYHNKKDIR